MPTTTILTLFCGVLAASDAAQLTVTTQRDMPVPMRDGVILRANVTQPATGGPYPVLVNRTPYGKGVATAFAKAGYIAVNQDVRGRYASDGVWESFLRFETHDAEDGYDTVEWAAKLPNSNGRVGVWGSSYGSFYAWKAASARPPSLAAIAGFSIPARYIDLEGPGTIRPGRRLNWWVTAMAPDMRLKTGRRGLTSKPKARELWKQGEGWKYLHFLPWMELPQEVFEYETQHVQYWLKNPHLDPWKLDEDCKEITTPAFDMVGWHDHCNGQMLLFRSLVAHGKTEVARRGSRIMIGPWNHAGCGASKYGNIDFGPEALFSKSALILRWFDYWLKGKQNGVGEDAQVKIFIMGDNRWRDERRWPLDRTQDEVMYLTSGGHANSLDGDGKLVRNPLHTLGIDQYDYDPANYVPSPAPLTSITCATDQRRLDDRRDILRYRSAPIHERIEITGSALVELYAATSAPDTDWFVRLIDVHPNGLARDVSSGVVRARYREGLDQPKLLKGGEVVKYVIEMTATSNAFLPGHGIRLDVTSSDFPNFDRNHNTAADQNTDAELRIAHQTIYHGGDRPTRIIMPRVPNAE